jgi:hypothetical protein
MESVEMRRSVRRRIELLCLWLLSELLARIERNGKRSSSMGLVLDRCGKRDSLLLIELTVWWVFARDRSEVRSLWESSSTIEASAPELVLVLISLLMLRKKLP